MMTDARLVASIALAATGVGWWLGVEIWRGWRREHSARVFWHHLTAPVVAIVLLSAAIVFALKSETMRIARNRKPMGSVERAGKVNSGGAILGRAGDTGIGPVATPVTLNLRYGAKIDE